jgi:hypothetical protein
MVTAAVGGASDLGSQLPEADSLGTEGRRYRARDAGPLG